MASCMIHLYTGWLYAQKNARLLRNPSFYLGCVMPDCVNVDGFADKETRWRAHVRAKDLSLWEKNAADFYHKNQGATSDALLTGYTIHILSDILWDRYFHDSVWSRAREMEPQQQNGFAPGWVECFRFDGERMRSLWWQDTIRPFLEQAHPESINGLPISLAEAYRRYLLYTYENTLPSEPPRILTLDHLRALGEYLVQAAEKIF